jgi:hypothetical protein
MVGETLEELEKLVELATRHNLQQLAVGKVVIIPGQKQPSLEELYALDKKLQTEAKITDEDILMNPYVGMNNLALEEKDHG